MALYSAAAGATVLQGPAPDFTLKSQSGSNLKLSEFRGQVVMLNFWASWCGPCRQEMPLIEQLHQRYSPLGFTVLGINVEEDSRKAQELLREIRVSFPILFDTQNSASKLYDVSAMPSTVFVDRDGNLRYLHKGYKPGYEHEYEKQIKALLRE
ncbi:MAG: redoxin [Gammaproteobacteria bacterium SG8_47]|nr:MAG: redoxin [Gammaproteobacteria bacterium SG8_47]